jgi:hypothetical protein
MALTIATAAEAGIAADAAATAGPRLAGLGVAAFYLDGRLARYRGARQRGCGCEGKKRVANDSSHLKSPC